MTVELSPLRQYGVYSFRGDDYVAVHLSTDGQAWQSTALLHPPGAAVPKRILYLRHKDGAVISGADFGPTGGTLADLIDTGRDESLDDIIVGGD